MRKPFFHIYQPNSRTPQYILWDKLVKVEQVDLAGNRYQLTLLNGEKIPLDVRDSNQKFIQEVLANSDSGLTTVRD